MKVEYDREEDILTIETSRTGKIDHAEEAGSFIHRFLESVGGNQILQSKNCRQHIAELFQTDL